MLVVRPIDFEAAEEHLKSIPGASKKAVSQSINFGLRKTKTLISRQIRAFYAVKLKDIYAAIPAGNIKWSTPATLNGKMICESPRLPAIAFNPRPRPSAAQGLHGQSKNIQMRRGKKISVEIRKGVRIEMAQGSYYNPGAKLTIMRRAAGAGRYPVKPVTTLGIALMLAETKVMPVISKQVRGLVMTELARQVDRFLNPKTPKAK